MSVQSRDRSDDVELQDDDTNSPLPRLQYWSSPHTAFWTQPPQRRRSTMTRYRDLDRLEILQEYRVPGDIEDCVHISDKNTRALSRSGSAQSRIQTALSPNLPDQPSRCSHTDEPRASDTSTAPASGPHVEIDAGCFPFLGRRNPQRVRSAAESNAHHRTSRFGEDLPEQHASVLATTLAETTRRSGQAMTTAETSSSPSSVKQNVLLCTGSYVSSCQAEKTFDGYQPNNGDSSLVRMPSNSRPFDGAGGETSVHYRHSTSSIFSRSGSRMEPSRQYIRSNSDKHLEYQRRSANGPLVDLTPRFQEPPQHRRRSGAYRPDYLGPGGLVEWATSPEDKISVPSSAAWHRGW